MKKLEWTYDLHLRGTTRSSLPIDALGDLLKRLAELLGSPEHVHLAAVRSGSARVLVKVDDEAIDDVRVQLVTAKLLEQQRVVRLSDFIAQRGWRGELRNVRGEVLIAFSPSEPRELVAERIVKQRASITGTVIKIGGKDETVPMQLQTGEGVFVDVTVKGRALARDLAHRLFDGVVRVHGTSTWRRSAEEEWTCAEMLVDSFDAPEGAPLTDMFRELGSLPGNEWNTMDDPHSHYRKWQSDEDA